MIDHGIGDLQTVAARAVNAGVDMDMVSDAFVGTLKQSVQEERYPCRPLILPVVLFWRQSIN